ncbi:MAG: hypothetical protein ACNI27_12860 [Desulfovibrio sp.]
MTPLLIQNALATFLQENLSTLQMDGQGKASGPPRIFIDALPPSLSDEEVYPFVIVRWLAGEDSGENDESLETFDLIIGVFGEAANNTGEYAAAVSAQWAMVAVTRLRRLLCENKILAKKYELQYPLHSKIPMPERLQSSYLQAVVTTQWSAPAPVQNLEA